MSADVGSANSDLGKRFNGYDEPHVTEIHLGSICFRLLQSIVPRKGETPSVFFPGILVYDDLDDPFAWQINMSDGGLREGIIAYSLPARKG